MLHTRLKALRPKFQQRFHFSISDLCARTSQWQFSGGKNCVSVEAQMNDTIILQHI